MPPVPGIPGNGQDGITWASVPEEQPEELLDCSFFIPSRPQPSSFFVLSAPPEQLSSSFSLVFLSLLHPMLMYWYLRGELYLQHPHSIPQRSLSSAPSSLPSGSVGNVWLKAVWIRSAAFLLSAAPTLRISGAIHL